MPKWEEFDNGISLIHIADQDGAYLAELRDPADADLKGWSVEVAKKSDPSGPTRIEEFVHEWRGNRGTCGPYTSTTWTTTS
jgi:hypothetical protein